VRSQGRREGGLALDMLVGVMVEGTFTLASVSANGSKEQE
jgi:hypothetical protein